MIVLVGSELCASCGRASGLVVVPLEGLTGYGGDPSDCGLCPGDAIACVPVWWDARMLPAELSALIEFGRERRRLGLPSLTDAVFH